MGTTVTTELVQDGARRDRIGRRHLPAERRLALLAQFRESGLTREAFARREGLRYTTFCGWVARASEASGPGAVPMARVKAPEVTTPRAPRIAFAQVALPASAAPGLEVRLPDGTTLRGGRVEELAALVRALRR
jgi:transposase-like protein